MAIGLSTYMVYEGLLLLCFSALLACPASHAVKPLSVIICIQAITHFVLLINRQARCSCHGLVSCGCNIIAGIFGVGYVIGFTYMFSEGCRWAILPVLFGFAITASHSEISYRERDISKRQMRLRRQHH